MNTEEQYQEPKEVQEDSSRPLSTEPAKEDLLFSKWCKNNGYTFWWSKAVYDKAMPHFIKKGDPYTADQVIAEYINSFSSQSQPPALPAVEEPAKYPCPQCLNLPFYCKDCKELIEKEAAKKPPAVEGEWIETRLSKENLICLLIKYKKNHKKAADKIEGLLFAPLTSRIAELQESWKRLSKRQERTNQQLGDAERKVKDLEQQLKELQAEIDDWENRLPYRALIRKNRNLEAALKEAEHQLKKLQEKQQQPKPEEGAKRALESMTDEEAVECLIDVFSVPAHVAWMDVEALKQYLCNNTAYILGSEEEDSKPMAHFEVTPQTFFNLTRWLLEKGFIIY